MVADSSGVDFPNQENEESSGNFENVGSNSARLGWGDTLIPGAASLPHHANSTTPQAEMENTYIIDSINTDSTIVEDISLPVKTLQSWQLKRMKYLCLSLSKFFQLWQHPTK